MGILIAIEIPRFVQTQAAARIHLRLALTGNLIPVVYNQSPLPPSTARIGNAWFGHAAPALESDDGVVMCTYIDQSMRKCNPVSIIDIRKTVLVAGKRRVGPCLMTTPTTILALLPVLTSTGRGSDIMIPMAIPVFGGMVIEVITMRVVPVLYCGSIEITVPRSK